MAPKTKLRDGGGSSSNRVAAALEMTEQEVQEPDMEDMLGPARKKPKTAGGCLRHATTVHDLQPEERRTVREELLRWYDAHRRKLPWRGDAPPFLSTATHTKQRVAVTASGTLDAFFQRDTIKSETSDALRVKQEGDAVGGGEEPAQEQLPRKVTPYETWVSEIMLQQTRVDTVVDYFLRWTSKFPTVAALATGSEEDVNSLWAGLGYYRRARMLHSGAKHVVENFGSELPSTVNELLTIPGIGPYTAGAISSIAFGNREPLVDGNVIRVLARLRAVGADPKNKQLIKFSWKTAGELVEECERPGELNQALMELGATMCTVQNPECGRCPVRTSCLAYEESQTRVKKTRGEECSEADACTICDASRSDEWGETRSEVTKYPLKAKKGDSKNEVICVSVVSYSDSDSDAAASAAPLSETKTRKAEVPASWRFLMAKRPDEGLLAGQWEFIHKKVDDGDKIPAFAQRKKLMDVRLSEILGEDAIATAKPKQIQSRRDLGELTHIFSHVKHHMGVEHLHFTARPKFSSSSSDPSSESLRWMSTDEMQQLGITTGVKKILALVATAGGGSSSVGAASSTRKRSSSASTTTTKSKIGTSRTSKRATSAKATLTKFFAK